MSGALRNDPVSGGPGSVSGSESGGSDGAGGSPIITESFRVTSVETDGGATDGPSMSMSEPDL